MKIEKIVAGLLVASLAVTPLTGVLETKAAETKAIEVYNQEITVYSFAQLENILKNGYGNILIKLAANITLEKGTKVNANITSVTIDGQGNTLTEAVASSASGTILINNKNTSQFTLKNMDIIGKNYYGPVVVDNSIRGANLYYENINYKGPQLIHNLSGYAHLSGNNKVTITQEIKNGNVAQEFAQATGVNISGKLVLDHGSLYDSVFWFGSANYAPSFLNILDDADVSVTVRNKDMFYVNDSASKPFSLRVGKNAKFNVVTYGNLFRSASMGAESISFEEGSDTQMTRINIQARELINLKNGSKPGALTVAKDASLTLGNVAGTVITGAKNSSVQLNNPRNVTLQGEAGNLLKYAGSLTFNTQKVEGWLNSFAMGTPYYQVEQSGNTPLMAVANVTAAGAVNLTSTNDGRLVGIPYTKAGTLRFSTEEEIDFELVNKITPNVLVFPEESNITGTCTADVDSITVTVNGVEYRGGVISGDKFEFYIVDKVKNVNDTVTINAFDKAGKLIDKKDVIVKAAI